MEILYILIPLSIILVALAIAIFGWAVKNGQYDDLEGPAHSILYDDDKDMIPGQNNKTQKKDLNTQDSQHSEKSDD
ncbi:cytochrome oxidase [Oleiphilus sp. HI0068]|jgi:cbb3-type cytochrome oxidase maturation protein|uniref:cbb3-type cytochrome oxidase assembly protein CcoS n=1 Tax=Oleiphilus sp. HI0132 TaxID=1822270 RepID=UPI0007C3727B|nr:cbb3-type cytochrome oxidase assembly protein CcoS [Oleiphilus sp. HI0132]KZY77487.1 cytochrome oxidase [Oleiphilus sp. HI0069]KZY77906.1 cytochrome oxidase [Oleiphilus sp. HI0068]KZZ34544.1 cytochrome oxidase [Oleiphilus sp. HI0085]KZY84127.1 cytochrome oxidase [Oleiphilus sp. HI0068]KZY87969.1 cytochrome oxidase [Oleiphilus sp. HI0069]